MILPSWARFLVQVNCLWIQPEWGPKTRMRPWLGHRHGKVRGRDNDSKPWKSTIRMGGAWGGGNTVSHFFTVVQYHDLELGGGSLMKNSDSDNMQWRQWPCTNILRSVTASHGPPMERDRITATANVIVWFRPFLVCHEFKFWDFSLKFERFRNTMMSL